MTITLIFIIYHQILRNHSHKAGKGHRVLRWRTQSGSGRKVVQPGSPETQDGAQYFDQNITFKFLREELV